VGCGCVNHWSICLSISVAKQEDVDKEADVKIFRPMDDNVLIEIDEILSIKSVLSVLP
jgi:hypothetical protein